MNLTHAGLCFSLISVKREEDTIRAGENPHLTALIQIAEISIAFELIEEMFILFGTGGFSFSVQAGLHVLPLCLSLVETGGWGPEQFRSSLREMRDQIGTVCQLATSVSMVALIFFGHVLYPSIALGALTLGFLERNHYLPLPCRQLLQNLSEPIGVISGIWSSSWILKIFASINAIGYASALSAPKEEVLAALPEGNLNTVKLRQILSGKLTLNINPDYLKHPVLPAAPSVNLQDLIRCFEQINWTNHLKALRKKLADDNRYLARYGSAYDKTDAELIAFANRSFKSLVSSIEQRAIREGEPKDYERLETYLRVIADRLLKETNEIAQVDALLRMAVEAGEYCGPGKFEVLEDLHNQSLFETRALSFPEKILLTLQEERNKISQSIYQKLYVNSLLTGWLDSLDIHNYNSFVSLFRRRWGLHKASLENDTTTAIDPLSASIIDWLIGGKMSQKFWESHTVEAMTNSLKERIGPQLPLPEFYAWWLAWIQRQPAQIKDDLTEELSQGKLLEYSIEENLPLFFQAMLFDLGILHQ